MEKSSLEIGGSYNSPLSRREVGLLAGWERERRVYVSIADLRRMVGVDPAPDVAKSLVRKGALMRLRPGLYLIRPLRTLQRPAAPSSVMSLGVLLHAEPYYVGGLWAFTFHRLTKQQYVSVLDAFVGRHHLARELFGARIVFHLLADKLLRYGIIRTTIEGVEVAVSDLERTLLDVLDHPRTVGGLHRGLELFTAGLDRADARKLVEYTARGSRDGTCRRVGVLLERAQGSQRGLAPLRRRLAGTRSLLSLAPGPRRGPVNNRWGVVENDR